MGLNLNYHDGQTPIDADELTHLKISTITLQSELDEFEQQNLEKAIEWSTKSKIKLDTILTEKFVKAVHERMFGDVWSWAGSFRESNKNIGVDKFEIATSIRVLLDDCTYWIEHNTFSHDEIAVRFKHRLVSIHPFPNGNGRHSRLMADILATRAFGLPIFTWGARMLVQEGKVRTEYIQALKKADKGEYGDLIAFARS